MPLMTESQNWYGSLLVRGHRTRAQPPIDLLGWDPVWLYANPGENHLIVRLSNESTPPRPFD
jgi:hypothetical protein